MEVVPQLGLLELIAGRGTGNLYSGEEDVIQRPGLPELIAELARSAADPGGRAGGVEKTPWLFLWLSSQD